MFTVAASFRLPENTYVLISPASGSSGARPELVLGPRMQLKKPTQGSLGELRHQEGVELGKRVVFVMSKPGAQAGVVAAVRCAGNEPAGRVSAPPEETRRASERNCQSGRASRPAAHEAIAR